MNFFIINPQQNSKTDQKVATSYLIGRHHYQNHQFQEEVHNSFLVTTMENDSSHSVDFCKSMSNETIICSSDSETFHLDSYQSELIDDEDVTTSNIYVLVSREMKMYCSESKNRAI